ncbi:tetratricopeptide repeat protein [Dokdonella sp.]|uniref:tetratricopeptide repeat protein n=1 Tax=Dokdonella sp. TaxID=2291710 RepID=UPI003526FB50
MKKSEPQAANKRLPTIGLLAVLIIVAAAVGWLFLEEQKAVDRRPEAIERITPDSPPDQPKPAFVGNQACAGCHASEHEAWTGSQHAKAMQVADSDSVLGDFSGASFEKDGVRSTFFQRDGHYFVRTDGPDGKLAEYPVKYTFGLEPLQQYLIELPGGRIQALGIAWDTRSGAEGGQKWFHLYPDQVLKPGDPLHWTGVDQNWNYQCADCHSTNLRKNYDADTRSFATDWSEINVSCEACHGPGSRHIEWAEKGEGEQEAGPSMGLTVDLDERHGASWILNAETGNAVRSKPRKHDREIQVCARCHARRGQNSDDFVAGQDFHEAFRPALIEPGLYYDDGQQRDEVFIHGSFLQSKMYSRGVTCSDCHEPHSGELRAVGNAVCSTCHLPGKFDTPAHSHHAVGSEGARCAACHMPDTVYMVNDARADHSFRIPRPDRTISMGTPNACNACHSDKSPEWAQAALADWYPDAKPGFQSFAEAFASAGRGEPGSRSRLANIAGDPAQPAIIRASAFRRMANAPTPLSLGAAAKGLSDPDADVRMAAVGVLAEADAPTRLGTLPRMLRDSSKIVRMDAARALVGEAEAQLSPSDRAAFDSALKEYIAAQQFEADRAHAQSNLGTLYLAQGKFQQAETALRTAFDIDPTFSTASINLADLYRAQGNDARAEQTLRDALTANAEDAAVNFSLGLTLIRQKRAEEALKYFAEAVRQAPEDAYFAYVNAIALNDGGVPGKAIEALEKALLSNPNDPGLLSLMATYQLRSGHEKKAAEYSKRLDALRESE